MNIEFRDSLWGGTIPDSLRNNRIRIAINKDTELSMSGEEFEEFKKMFDEKTQELFEQAQYTIRNRDNKDDLLKKIGDEVERLMKKETVSWLELSEIRTMIADYWMIDWGHIVEAGAK
jgi:hypothetical protein